MDEKNRARKRKVGFIIRMQHTAFTRRFMNDGAANGIDEVTIMHGWVMGYIHRNEDRDIYQKTLESELGIGRSAVASLAKIMEKKGYISREAVPGDARLKKIVLTPQGREMAIRMKDTLDAMEDAMLLGISQEELAIYFKVADQIISNLDSQKSEERKK